MGCDAEAVGGGIDVADGRSGGRLLRLLWCRMGVGLEGKIDLCLSIVFRSVVR